MFQESKKLRFVSLYLFCDGQCLATDFIMITNIYEPHISTSVTDENQANRDRKYFLCKPPLLTNTAPMARNFIYFYHLTFKTLLNLNFFFNFFFLLKSS